MSPNPSNPPQITRGSPTSLDDLLGQWYISQSTSSHWSDKRNVILTYSALPSTSNNNNTTTTQPQLDDQITYQSRDSPKLQTMRGIDTRSATDPASWTWRGKGLLRFVTNKWEILGYGGMESGKEEEEEEKDEGEGAWFVVLAEKSIFTPAVVNLCTRGKAGLGAERVEELKAFLKGCGKEELGRLADELQGVLQE
ncbi:MAG: hypothetical protein M1835_002197 [Candelina submexicana]|nr:MAG: hypothetical protein M1835_002197 [Candelina submexicana]